MKEVGCLLDFQFTEFSFDQEKDELNQGKYLLSYSNKTFK